MIEYQETLDFFLKEIDNFILERFDKSSYDYFKFKEIIKIIEKEDCTSQAQKIDELEEEVDELEDEKERLMLIIKKLKS